MWWFFLLLTEHSLLVDTAHLKCLCNNKCCANTGIKTIVFFKKEDVMTLCFSRTDILRGREMLPTLKWLTFVYLTLSSCKSAHLFQPWTVSNCGILEHFFFHLLSSVLPTQTKSNQWWSKQTKLSSAIQCICILIFKFPHISRELMGSFSFCYSNSTVTESPSVFSLTWIRYEFCYCKVEQLV